MSQGDSNKGRTGLIVAAMLVPALMLGLMVIITITGATPAAAGCDLSGKAIAPDLAGVPAGPVAGYNHEQLNNAASIMLAAQQLGLTVRDQQIGIMTAMGESSLTVLNRGDAVGPDSRGLFQQRDNGAWGTLADRMDPLISATNFFTKLAQVEGRSTLAPTLVAHAVQANADPFYYEPFWAPAGEVLRAVAGATAPASASSGPSAVASPTGSASTTTAPAAAAAGCGGASSGTVAASGWAQPAHGPVTSGYGPRGSCGGICSTWHYGIDIAPPCDAPIWAANSGTVVYAGPSSGYGNLIEIDHGSGVHTRYGHMYNDGVLVAVGDQVSAGQQIGKVGSNGNSTGCHLHFEVLINGQHVDPAVFLAQVGVSTT